MTHVESQSTVAVDVFDSRFFYKQLEVSGEYGNFKLILDPALKPGQHFAMAWLLDECAFSRKLLFKYPRSRRVAVLQESPLRDFYQQADFLIRHYDIVFTFHHELLALGAPFQRLDIGGSWLDAPLAVGMAGKNQLVSFMGSVQHDDNGGYALRKQVAAKMLEDERVQCFGRGINEVEHKTDALAAFQFSIAMENCAANYYYTEKLIDCFMAETVPIYWGCSAIADIFDARGMLLFNDIEQLNALLDNISPEQYVSMRPYVLENRERALQLGLTSYHGFYSRLLAQLGDRVAEPVPSTVWWSARHSKLAATARFVLERLRNL